MIDIDKIAQRLAVKRRSDIIFPFEFRVETRDDIRITAFPVLKKFAEEFEAKHKGDYFSERSLAEVRKAAFNVVTRYGYEENIASRKYYHEYQIDSSSALSRDRIRTDSVLMTRWDDERNETTFDLRALLKYGHGIAVTIIENAVVSISASHQPIDDGEVIEIGTETAPGYRGRGFAESNTALLCEMLLNRGKTVLYCCSNENKKSQHIARKVGFVEIAQQYYYIGRRKA